MGNQGRIRPLKKFRQMSTQGQNPHLKAKGKTMKHVLLGAALVALSGTALAATNVDVSVNIGQPGFYGHIDIGGMPPPQLVYARPVVIQQPVGVVYQPVYLRVPPGHEKNWRKHCQRYNACGRPVYFVQDTWYTNVYAPQYRAEHGGSKGHKGNNGHDNGKGHDKGNKGKGHD